MSDTWHRVGTIGDVSEDAPLAARAGGAEIGIFLVDGVLHAIENVCPHAFALHQAVFRIPTGECLREPADRDLTTYSVKVEDGAILVRV